MKSAISLFEFRSGLANCFVVGLVCFFFGGCQKSKSESATTKKEISRTNAESGSTGNPAEEGNDGKTEDKSFLEKTTGVIQNATSTSLDAAGKAGNWVKDKVQDTIGSGTEATIAAGRTLREIFQKAKEQGTTTAQDITEFVKEDIAKLGAWEYTSRTIGHEKPNEIVTMLNHMGRQKWECFWVDRQKNQTVLYFKKSPRSYISRIPFRDLIRYLPELGGDSGNTP